MQAVSAASATAGSRSHTGAVHLRAADTLQPAGPALLRLGSKGVLSAAVLWMPNNTGEFLHLHSIHIVSRVYLEILGVC